MTKASLIHPTAGAFFELALLCATLLQACGSSADSEVDVPLTALLVQSSPRLIVSVQIGDAPPFQAILDSGSAGLRVVQGTVPDSEFIPQPQEPVSETFHSGLQVSGMVAFASVQLGTLATPQPISVELIASATCASGSASCDQSALDPKNPFWGYPAILGVGMRTQALLFQLPQPPEVDVGNPIVQLTGAPSFVIEAPKFGKFPTDGTPGKLRINPKALSGYITYQLTPNPNVGMLGEKGGAWYDDDVPTCITDGTDQSLSTCAGGLLDCGNPSVQVELPQAPTTAWLAGTDVALTIGPSAQPMASYEYVIGTDPLQGFDATQTDDSGDGRALINAGISVFFRYDVVFDQVDGIVGLGPKPN
jgi:hypothetical protein